MEEVDRKPSLSTVRYVSFNINGTKTIFNYHPWNEINRDLARLFSALDADIITLQELKLTPQTLQSVKDIGHLAGYRSFVSLPKVKKGYSGVGLFVRIPQPDEPVQVHNSLTVIKAEQGLTGCLNEEDAPGIGGYPEIDEETAQSLDSEGRCVVVEFANNTVVFALYCPANSMATEDGEQFRLLFLQTLLERCCRLHFLGKTVVIMGDINVSLDLIDSAEGMSDRFKNNLIRPSTNSMAFESFNYEECIKFKASTEARTILNSYTFPTLKNDLDLQRDLLNSPKQFLYDTTRLFQGRRMAIYTVWNTLTGARATNFGSRIDLILTNNPLMAQHISNASIWPGILGSDHCPVFTDFDVLYQSPERIEFTERIPFEAKYYYKLSKARDISLLFGKRSESPSTTAVVTSQSALPPPEPLQSKLKYHYVSRKVAKVTKPPAKPPAKQSKPSSIQYVSRKSKESTVLQKGIGNYFKK